MQGPGVQCQVCSVRCGVQPNVESGERRTFEEVVRGRDQITPHIFADF